MPSLTSRNNEIRCITYPPFSPTAKYVVFYDHNGCSAYTCGVHGGLTPSALINKKRIIKHSAFWEIWANAHCTHADVALAAPLRAPSNFTWSYPSAKGRGGRTPAISRQTGVLCERWESCKWFSGVSFSTIQSSSSPPRSANGVEGLCEDAVLYSAPCFRRTLGDDVNIH